MSDKEFNSKVKSLEFNEIIGRVYFGKQEVGIVYGADQHWASDVKRNKSFKIMLDGLVVFSASILVKWTHATGVGYELFESRIPDSAIQSWKASGLRWVPEESVEILEETEAVSK